MINLSRFRHGKPLDLARVLADFNPRDSSITISDLEENVTGYIESGHSHVATGHPLSDNVYFFLRVDKSDISVKLAGHYEIYISLNPGMYGFTFEKVDIHPRRMNLELVPEAEKEYGKLLKSNRVKIADLLETAGFVINRSMSYDFEKLIKTCQEKNFETGQYRILRETYSPYGDEVTKGLCGDSGKLIRSILINMNLPSRYLFTPVKAKEGFDVTHDTTLFVDTFSGRWAVVNSKSFSKPYNLVPKHKLHELDKPYAA